MNKGKEESREREEGGTRKAKRQGHEEGEQGKRGVLHIFLKMQGQKDRLVDCVGHDLNFQD